MMSSCYIVYLIQGEEEMVSDHHKSCVDCKTTKTPLWRSGPSGPKVISLVFFCG